MAIFFIAQKQKFHEQYDRWARSQQAPSRAVLALLAKSVLNLATPLNRTAISRIILSRNKIFRVAKANHGKFRSYRSVTVPRVECALCVWLFEKVGKGVQVNGAVLKHRVSLL